MSFLTRQFVIEGFAATFRLDRTNTGEEILVYVQHGILSKLLNISYVSSDTECLVNYVKQSGYRYVPIILAKTIFQII